MIWCNRQRRSQKALAEWEYAAMMTQGMKMSAVTALHRHVRGRGRLSLWNSSFCDFHFVVIDSVDRFKRDLMHLI